MLTRPTLNAIRRLPLDARETLAAAELLRIQAAGEQIARQGAEEQARLAPTLEERRFLRRQVRQEQLHTIVFEQAARALLPSGAMQVPLPEALMRVRARLQVELAAGDYPAAVAIQHVALEGLGHVVLELLGRELVAHSRAFDAIRRMILKHEDAHFAFGRRVLQAHGEDDRLRPNVFRALDDAEQIVLELAPRFAILGGDVANVIEPMHAGVHASLNGASA